MLQRSYRSKVWSSLRLHPYFVYMSSQCSDESAHLGQAPKVSLWAFVVQNVTNTKNIVCLLIYVEKKEFI